MPAFSHASNRTGSPRVGFETKPWPFLGPKRRAFEALSQPILRVLSPDEFLGYIDVNLPDCYDQLEWVRFHSFRLRGFGDSIVNIAVCLVGPSPKVRDKLFQMAYAITRATGWYPLVQGSRADAATAPYQEVITQLHGNAASPESGAIGTILRVEALSDSMDGGTCFHVAGSKGSWLLDTGKQERSSYPADLSAVLLTHMHGDHSGGVWSLAGSAPAPVFLSEATLTALWNMPGVSAEAKTSLLRRSHLCTGNDTIGPADGSHVEFFPVFHAPGAIGIRIVDEVANMLVYFGDICLKNGFLNYAEEALAMVLKGDARSRTVLLDATMAGRREHVIDPEDSPEVILHAAAEGVLKRNVIFVGTQPESLVYTFLRAFYLTQRIRDTAIRFLVSEELFQLIRAIYRPVLKRIPGAVDRLAQELLGKRLTSNFAETHRLYPLRPQVLKEIPETEPVVILAQPKDLATTEGLAERLNRANIYLSGTSALRDDLPQPLVAARPKSISRVATPDWGFHSNQQDLAEFIRRLTEHGVRVGLFHGFPNAIKKFIKHNALDPKLVTVTASTPLLFGE